MTIEQIAARIREEHRKYADKEGMDWAMLAASKIKAEMQPSKRLTMADVLLACGELNKRERVAVEWVLDRVQCGLTVDEAMEVAKEWDALHVFGHQSWDSLRDMLTAKLSSK